MAKKKIYNSKNIVKPSNTVGWEDVTNHTKLTPYVNHSIKNQELYQYALRLADDYDKPLRYKLYEVYKDVVRYDAHLKSLIQNRQNRLKQLDFVIRDVDGNVDLEYSKKFKKIWFSTVIDKFIDSIFYGHSLLSINSITNNNIDSVTLIDRSFVSPEKGLILEDYYNLTGYDYRDISNADNNFLIEIGDKYDLGLLETLSPLALFKKFDLQFWNMFIELYGIPYRIGKVTSDDQKSRKNMFEALKNMGAAGFAILNNKDSIEFADNKATGGGSIYSDMINLANSEMSKLVLGAAGITDGLMSGTQAQSSVHQLQLDVVTKSDTINFEYFVNQTLLPKLSLFNVIPEGYEFDFLTPERLAQQFAKVELDTKVANLVKSDVFDLDYLVEEYDFVPKKTK